jgi:hypothetical protein
MLSISDVLFGLLLPALIGIVLFFVGRRALDRNSNQSAFWRYNDGSATAFALGLAFLLGCSGLNQNPTLPLKDPFHCLYLATIVLLLISFLYQFIWRALWFRTIASLIVLAAAIGGIISLLPEQSWTNAQKITWFSGGWLASAVLFFGLGYACRPAADSSASGVASAAALTVISAFAAAVLGMSSCKVYGQVAGIVPATLIPIVLLGICLRTTLNSFDFAAQFVLLFGGMLLSGYLFTELTACNAILLFVSPLVLLISRIPAVQKLKNWQCGAIQFSAALIPSGIAFGLALLKFLPDMAASGGF